MRLLLAILLLLLTAPAGYGDIWQVPGDFISIQDAIDASTDGDMVIVDSGTYMENLDFDGKAIHVRSWVGPQYTHIRNAGGGSVVKFNSYEGPDSILEGFRISQGNANWGGGIYCCYSSPTIRGNIIRDNSAYNGGGIFCCQYSSPHIVDNYIEDNFSTSTGGGIVAVESTPLIEGNTVSGNTGSGISCAHARADVRFNKVLYNQGTGILFDNCWGEAIGNLISSNDDFGFHLILSDVHLYNNVVHNNQGSGIFCELCDNYPPDIFNCTVFANQGDQGGGLRCLDSNPNVVNTIIWDNWAPVGPEISVESSSSASKLFVSYCNLKGGMAGVVLDENSQIDWGEGMIDDDPAFAPTDAWDAHLLYYSPCRDQGNEAILGSIVNDMEGDPRVLGGGVDIGADEYGPRLYTSGNAMPGGTVQANFIGEPDMEPVRIWFSFRLLEDGPIPTPWGDWFLELPLAGPLQLEPIPSTGFQVLSDTLPLGPKAPYEMPMQGFIGSKLTNAAILKVR